jgi:hypothetical protein
MPDFYIYWNITSGRLRIHRNHCGACNDGLGMHRGRIAEGRGITDDWIGANTYPDARRIAVALQRDKPVLRRNRQNVDCGLCRPNARR